jgi:hypothetical protein
MVTHQKRFPLQALRYGGTLFRANQNKSRFI